MVFWDWYSYYSLFTDEDMAVFWMKWSESHSVISDSWWPKNSPGQNTGMGSLSLPPGDFPNPGIEPRSPALQADSLPAEPPGKPKNTGVGSLSVLQGIFPTQESNWGLLHCRQILYQLSYEGSPEYLRWSPKMTATQPVEPVNLNFLRKKGSLQR